MKYCFCILLGNVSVAIVQCIS